MTKKVVRKKKKEDKIVEEDDSAVSHPVTQIYYEIDTLKEMMQIYSDLDLYEFALPHIELYEHREMDRLYLKVTQGKDLSKDERKKLEAFCILANTELFLVV